MIYKTSNLAASKMLPALAAAGSFCALGALSQAAPQAKPVQAAQKAFATPEQAAQALTAAAERYDVPALLEMFGPDGKDLVTSEDPVLDKNRAVEFAALAHEKASVVVDPKTSKSAVVSVGNDDWPFLVPIVKAKWTVVLRFSGRARRDSFAARR